MNYSSLVGVKGQHYPMITSGLSHVPGTPHTLARHSHPTVVPHVVVLGRAKHVGEEVPAPLAVPHHQHPRVEEGAAQVVCSHHVRRARRTGINPLV